MKKSAIRKDFYMEIKKSINRFLSIFLIVALGVAFFAGIRATQPDMILTIDSYFDDSRLLDIRVHSTLGLTEEDADSIANTNGIEDAEPIYSTHVVCDTDANSLVIEVISATDRINQVTVTNGRMPQTNQEVLVDPFFIESSGYKLGDTITLSSGTDQDLHDILTKDEFTIVGIGTTSYYLSFQRGRTDIGTGEVNSYIVVLPEAFALEVYTGVYALAEGARDLTSYTDEYVTKVDAVAAKIEDLAEVRAQERYQEIYEEATDRIAKARQQLTDRRDEAEEKLLESQNYLQATLVDEIQLQAAIQELEMQKATMETEFEQAEKEIMEAEEDLSKIPIPEWYVLDRNSIEAYVEYEQNAERIGAIGQVFPVIFFLVAALISLATMTRMVEEERMQIGTLKALGYSKHAIAMKYLLYALLATLGGSIAGALVGLKVLPTIIITAYKIMYTNIPKVITPFNTYYAVLATLISVITVELATIFACYKELLAKPATLMRPVAPKSGKRVVLERIPSLWSKISFSKKATIRNLFRYKKRFLMTVFGIGGCMALLMVGFGIRDSIFVIYSRQFDEIILYDASLKYDVDASEEQFRNLQEEMEANDHIKSSIKVRENMVDIQYQGNAESVTMIIPESPEKAKDFIVFRNREGHENYELNGNGVILTEQIAKRLGVRVGDRIAIKEGERKAEANVAAITENYMSHYMYLTPQRYRELFGEEPEFNEYFLQISGTVTDIEYQVGNELLEHSAAKGIFYVNYFRNLLDNVLVSLNVVVWVLIIAAGALAFVVLYNLNNININERRRELATIKVLGFFNNELAAYVYRENIILTIMGTILGIVLGSFLHQYVIETVEIEMMMFGRNIELRSYIYSILLTLLFSAIVNFVMYYKLKKINMVESLKSVE